MAERKTSFAQDEYYHLYNRGVEKRIIFQDEQDYKHFLHLLYICNTERSLTLRDIGKDFDRGVPIVSIGAYCLMPNHFHILIKEKKEGGISTYMRKLLTAYAMYFNKKNKRTGKLFESAFKSSHIEDDRYLRYIYSYIHLNPAKLIDKSWKEKKGAHADVLLKYISSYPYSSFPEYLSGIPEVLHPTDFPRYFNTIKDHTKELFSWLSYGAENTPIGNSYGFD